MHLDVDQAQPLSTGAHVKRHIVQPRSQPILCKHRVISLAVYAGLEPSSRFSSSATSPEGAKHLYDFAASTRSLLNMRYDKTGSGWGRGDAVWAPKPREISRRNARGTQLAAALTKATGVKQDSLDDQLAQAKVQAELDQDEVDNAKQELTRAGAADCNAYRYASE